jgi:hypothetical protein
LIVLLLSLRPSGSVSENKLKKRPTLTLTASVGDTEAIQEIKVAKQQETTKTSDRKQKNLKNSFFP